MSRKIRDILFAPGWYDPRLHEGVARYARERHWRLRAEWAPFLQFPTGWDGDGILTVLQPKHPVTVQVLRQKKPIVAAGLDFPNVSLPRVAIDEVESGRLVGRYFTALGYEHFAYAYIWPAWFVNQHITGLREIVQPEGFNLHLLHLSVYPISASHPRAEATNRQLRMLPKPIAVFAQHDTIGCMIIEHALQLGFQVPQDIAVVSIPNTPVICDHALVSLSSVETNLEEEGYQAAKLLDAILSGETVPEQPILLKPKTIIERASTNAVGFSNSNLRLALNCIRQNYNQPLNVNEVSRTAGVNRRTLEQLFQFHLRRTVLDEIHRCRIEAVKKLLRHTDLPANKIALETGFRSERHMYRLFRKTTGLTTRDYRRAALNETKRSATK